MIMTCAGERKSLIFIDAPDAFAGCDGTATVLFRRLQPIADTGFRQNVLLSIGSARPGSKMTTGPSLPSYSSAMALSDSADAPGGRHDGAKRARAEKQ